MQLTNPLYKNIGRNELCPCGSGKKYKKCHWNTPDEMLTRFDEKLVTPQYYELLRLRQFKSFTKLTILLAQQVLKDISYIFYCIPYGEDISTIGTYC